MTKRVVYVFPASHRFRVPFHEKLRVDLARHDIQYDYVYSSRFDSAGRDNTAVVPWAIDSPMWTLRAGARRLTYLPLPKAVRSADLVIIQQENSLLSNYAIQLSRYFGRRRVAFFGHGRNFQTAAQDGPAEQFKRFWLRKVDWWFAYTQRSADVVAEAGFPADRITIFNNAIDTSALRAERADIGDQELAATRASLVGSSENVGVYVGGLYHEKRIPFLLDAARRIRARVPDFHLIVIGGGPDAAVVAEAGGRDNWIHFMGPKFGREKTLLTSLGKVMLMPGLVGLGVLDSFAYGIPMVTTSYPFHSPEIAYLKSGYNGIIVDDYESVDAYVDDVVDVLTNSSFSDSLRDGALKSADIYTMDAMVGRFSNGVQLALR